MRSLSYSKRQLKLQATGVFRFM